MPPSTASTPIHALPAEVLTRIFDFSISHYYPCGCLLPLRLHRGTQPPFVKSPPEPFTFSKVCTRWKAICHTTPQLWNLLFIDIGNPIGIHAILADLEERIKYAGETPLILGINSPIMPSGPGIASAQPLATQFIHRHVHRWASIYARVSWWPSIILSSPRPFSQLRELATLRSQITRGLYIRPNLLPALSVIGLMDSNLSLIQISWDRLTVFEGIMSSPKDIAHVLQNAPALIHLYLLLSMGSTSVAHPSTSSSFQLDPPDSSRSKAVHLPNLQTLDVLLMTKSNDQTLSFFHSINAPNLKLLRWSSGLQYDPVPIDALTTLVTNSGCSLDALLVSVCVPIASDPSQMSTEGVEALIQGIPFLDQSHIIFRTDTVGDFVYPHALWSHWGTICGDCHSRAIWEPHACRGRIAHRFPTTLNHDHVACKICSGEGFRSE